MATTRRIYPARRAGISATSKRTALFWRGKRAEKIIRTRMNQYTAEKEAKALARRSRKTSS